MKSSEKVLTLTYLLVPFVVLSAGMIHKGHHLSFVIASMFLMASMLTNVWFRWFGYYAGTWTIYIAISMTFIKSSDPATLTKVSGAMLYVLIASLVFYLSSDKTRRDVVYNLICIAALLQVSLGVMQLWEYDPIFNFYSLFMNVRKGIPEIVTTGTLGNNNFYAAFLTISLPFFFRKYWAYCVPIILAMVFSAITTTALVALMVGCTYYLYKKINLGWIVAGLMPLCAYITYTKQSWTIKFFSSEHDRIDMWMDGITQACGHPLSIIFGLGPGAPWKHGYPMHNEFVTMFHHFGIIGCVLLICYMATLPRTNKILLASFIIACVNCIGTYPMHLAPSAFLILIVMGLLERERCQSKVQPQGYMKVSSFMS